MVTTKYKSYIKEKDVPISFYLISYCNCKFNEMREWNRGKTDYYSLRFDVNTTLNRFSLDVLFDPVEIYADGIQSWL